MAAGGHLECCHKSYLALSRTPKEQGLPAHQTW